MGYNGPIQGHQQLPSYTTLGPFDNFGSFSHKQHWATLWLAIIFLSKNGPTQVFRKVIIKIMDTHSQWAHLYPTHYLPSMGPHGLS
jgi:hypothetical protein